MVNDVAPGSRSGDTGLTPSWLVGASGEEGEPVVWASPLPKTALTAYADFAR